MHGESLSVYEGVFFNPHEQKERMHTSLWYIWPVTEALMLRHMDSAWVEVSVLDTLTKTLLGVERTLAHTLFPSSVDPNSRIST
jgi:hypothetical protein